MKPNRYDHDKALEMAWSGRLTDEDRNICDIVASAFTCGMDVQDDHYEQFQEIELKFDCSYF